MKYIIITILIFLSSNIVAQNNCLIDLSYHLDYNANLKPFYHGVASGDALHDKVIIWTRITPDKLTDSIVVQWFMSSDSIFSENVNTGSYTTYFTRDYTVKLDITGLQPDTKYYYYFVALGEKSIVGQTKTPPKGEVFDESIRIAVFTGSNYNAGYYNVYNSVAKRKDIDAIFHLGDYIYEYASADYGKHSERWLFPDKELLSLADYRQRYSHYRLDLDLQAVHQVFPWYIIWDDHEIANDSWLNGAQNHNKNEGSWSVRKKNAKQAFYEWLPIRENKDTSIYRVVNFGNIMNVIFLDTRHEGRAQQKDLHATDSTKNLLGKEQYNWFIAKLQSSNNATWKLVAQQVMFAPLMILQKVINPDQWDGYQAERKNILEYILDNNIENIFFLSGDIHTSWANDVYLEKKDYKRFGNPNKKKRTSVTTEFITPSVTSPSFGLLKGIGGKILIKMLMKHIKYVELRHKGYIILDVNHKRVKADWYFVNTVKKRKYKEKYVISWYINKGESFLRKSKIPSDRKNKK